MAKKEISATELVGTDVQFVSLVKRGANRIPFRITKEDQNMIDLHKIGRNLFKIAEPKPEIVGAILRKGVDEDKVYDLLKEAGVSSEFIKSEKDGLVTLAKSDMASAKDTIVLKLSDEVALVVSDVKKVFSGIEFSSTSFGDVHTTEGYFTGVCTAIDALKSTIINVMMDAGSPNEASAQIAKATDDMKAYLVSLTGGLPVQAFKADAAINTAGSLAKAESCDDEDKEDEKDMESKKKEDEAPAEAAAPAPAEEAAIEKASDSDEVVAEEPVAKADEVEPVAKADDAMEEDEEGDVLEPEDSESGAGAPKRGPKAPKVKDDSEVLAAIAALKASFEASIDDVRKSVAEVSSRVDEASVLARKTDAALNGTVFNETAGDAAHLQKTEKVIPLLDTAYSRRTA